MAALPKASPAALAGQFCEVTSIYGQRIVVMFSKNNHFVFDNTDPRHPTTPMVLREEDEPVVLGSLVQYVKNNDLVQALAKVDEYLKSNLPDRQSDSLFMCRTLHWLKQNDLHISPSPKSIEDGIQAALQVEQDVYNLHGFIKKVEALAAAS